MQLSCGVSIDPFRLVNSVWLFNYKTLPSSTILFFVGWIFPSKTNFIKTFGEGLQSHWRREGICCCSLNWRTWPLFNDTTLILESACFIVSLQSWRIIIHVCRRVYTSIYIITLNTSKYALFLRQVIFYQESCSYLFIRVLFIPTDVL